MIDNVLPAGNPRLSRQTAMRGLARLVNLYEIHETVREWLREVSYCCFLTFLPVPAWILLDCFANHFVHAVLGMRLDHKPE